MANKDPEKRRAYNRAYAAAHRKERRVWTLAWREANPETRRATQAAHHANRTARLANVTGSITIADVCAVWAVGHCVYCGGDGTGLDHVIPLSRGGANDRSNLVRCCVPCNSSKGRRTPEEWRAADHR